jgi:hypothetical protein
MTEAQAAYLKRLSEDAGEEFDPSLSKAAASRRIDELRSRPRSGRPKRGEGGERQAPPAKRERAASGETGDGGEPMSEAQAAYLKELAEEEGGEFDPSYSKHEAARRIGELLIRQMSRMSPTEPSRR